MSNLNGKLNVYFKHCSDLLITYEKSADGQLMGSYFINSVNVLTSDMIRSQIPGPYRV